MIPTTQPETTEDIRAALAYFRNARATADRVVHFGPTGDDTFGDGSRSGRRPRRDPVHPVGDHRDLADGDQCEDRLEGFVCDRIGGREGSEIT